MRFENAREAVKHAQTFHKQLSALYQGLTKQEYPAKTNLLLKYMSDQERDLADLLMQFEQNTPTGVLDTWIQYADDQNILKAPNIDVLSAIQSMEDVLTLSVTMSNEFITLYQQVEEQLDEMKVKDIFRNLANMQLQKQKRVSMNYNRLLDM
jgi:hypothetical protein